MSAGAFYQLMHQTYELPSGGDTYFTIIRMATEKKRGVFATIFDVNLVESLATQRDLEPSWRFLFINRHNVKILAEKQVAVAEEKKKRKKKQKISSGTQGKNPSVSIRDPSNAGKLKEQADSTAGALKLQRSELARLRHSRTRLETQRAEIAHSYRKAEQVSSEGRKIYTELKKIRSEINAMNIEIREKEEAVQGASQRLYDINSKLAGKKKGMPEHNEEEMMRRTADVVEKHSQGLSIWGLRVAIPTVPSQLLSSRWMLLKP
ncbi:uncharacterized protein BYT42DRAFT_133093 [Radiomyces spectabilis]|uniref:uncharacterized protein n=1 Tax=Radiomyces spectabilis TaxID=64574 RepID=UPI00221F6069|nr:uncharacterized protein BYT42DRAFT_133093 [Radiomyces spectabilis]KAI8367616.1 hypothetical protein BYT42DRAFT_133093 [Radiomyces spectabilis]